MRTVEESIELMNQTIYKLLEEDAIGNINKIKELTRAIQRLRRAR